MKKILLIPSLLFSFVIMAQVTAGQVDDFRDGTKQGWSDTGPAAPFTTNVEGGGPDGAEDSYLRNTTSGMAAGAGSRMIIKNSTQWIGNFTSEGIQSIIVDVRALTADVTVRISMRGAGGKIASTTGIPVTAGSGWTQVTIPINAANMQTVSDGAGGGPDGTDVAATLAAVTEFRLLSSTTPAWAGEITNAEMHFDNITASTVLSTPEFENVDTEFTISPNPGTNKLNVKLTNTAEDIKLDVFDVLGKRIYRGLMTQLESAINISSWNSGMYLVRISNDKITQTKRFIKQ